MPHLYRRCGRGKKSAKCCICGDVFPIISVNKNTILHHLITHHPIECYTCESEECDGIFVNQIDANHEFHQMFEY
ncbi:MAG: hypothetical protein ACW98X_19895 [Promethearchaeota archaeon]|jgi:hypothetical protein